MQKISAKNKWFFAKNKCKSANMWSSTVQLHGVDLILIIKTDFYIILTACGYIVSVETL